MVSAVATVLKGNHHLCRKNKQSVTRLSGILQENEKPKCKKQDSLYLENYYLSNKRKAFTFFQH